MSEGFTAIHNGTVVIVEFFRMAHAGWEVNVRTTNKRGDYYRVDKRDTATHLVSSLRTQYTKDGYDIKELRRIP